MWQRWGETFRNHHLLRLGWLRQRLNTTAALNTVLIFYLSYMLPGTELTVDRLWRCCFLCFLSTELLSLTWGWWTFLGDILVLKQINPLPEVLFLFFYCSQVVQGSNFIPAPFLLSLHVLCVCVCVYVYVCVWVRGGSPVASHSPKTHYVDSRDSEFLPGVSERCVLCVCDGLITCPGTARFAGLDSSKPRHLDE